VDPSVVVVIPAFNEEDRLGETLRSIAALGRARGAPMPVILADDGSQDRTIEVADETARREGVDLAILRLPHAGKAWAVRSGMLHAAAFTDVDYVLMLDADNEIAVDQLAGVQWAPDPSTIYIGRRVASIGDRQGAQPRPIRRVTSAGMRTLSRLLLALPFSDTQCGFKLYPRHLAGALFGQQRCHGWVFDAEILAIAVRSGIPIVEVPVVWSPRGVSRVRPSTLVTSVLDMLAIATRLMARRYSIDP
jgi:dolichyl-phosphate beta-glucosyltransferase